MTDSLPGEIDDFLEAIWAALGMNPDSRKKTIDRIHEIRAQAAYVEALRAEIARLRKSQP